MKPVVLYGSATHDNEGDLAMMRGLIAWLARNGSADRMHLLTRNPERSRRDIGIPCDLSHDTMLLAAPADRPISRAALAWRGLGFLGQVAIWKFGPARWRERFIPPVNRAAIALLAGSAAVIVHGSGSFNSVFWRGWLYPKAITAVALRWLGVPLLMTSQGIGPLDHPLDRWMARRFFRVARLVGVRDGDTSRRVARELGAPADRIVHTGDDAELVPPADDTVVDAALRAESVPAGRPLFGVNFRDAASYAAGHEDTGHALLAAALDHLIEATGVHVVFLPITYDPIDDDRVSADRVVGLMQHAVHTTVLRARYDAATLRGIASRFTALAGASYHALLFALAAGVPVIALTKNSYYAAKHEGLLHWFGCRGAQVLMASPDAAHLAAALIDLVMNREARAAALEAGRAARASAAAEGRARLLREIPR
ncbi:MAG TPA: polysaccharide pyruvyl transferase family protein [Kiritimatiellia bacterium]|nr:polysaccharide pyruvyl transferase family protein [Kiritimatiellia bacterium]HMP32758.1 polysaccharide pyruvyl transferase family protein [Kiritimatiellia bacterium]